MVNITEITDDLNRLTLKQRPADYADRLQGQRSANLAKRLLELTKCNGYEIIQTNGQRVYAPPASRNIPVPPKGSEIFIGKLAKNLFEDELVPVFERIGPLYKLRLMLDFTEKTRGYAFATYFSQAHANAAVATLHNYEIRPGLHIAVYKSVDNCRLFLGQHPPEVTQLDVLQLVARYAQGVRSVVMYQQYDQPEMNRGFAFVEFDSHRAAAMARRQFAPENLIAWGRRLYVDWADPLPEVEPNVMAKVTVLYMRNLPLDYTPNEVRNLVCNLVGSQIVTRVHKIHNFAFVHFYDRAAAEFALSRLQSKYENYISLVSLSSAKRDKEKISRGCAIALAKSQINSRSSRHFSSVNF
nr:unnamed protein product [Callosobruchus analis]